VHSELKTKSRKDGYMTATALFNKQDMLKLLGDERVEVLIDVENTVIAFRASGQSNPKAFKITKPAYVSISAPIKALGITQKQVVTVPFTFENGLLKLNLKEMKNGNET
jgi:hypothetical protein